jgi:hypothetical protein
MHRDGGYATLAIYSTPPYDDIPPRRERVGRRPQAVDERS